MDQIETNSLTNLNHSDVISIHAEFVDDAELAQWSEYRPLSFRMAVQCASHLPRGKAFVSRLIGKYWAHNEKIVIRTRSHACLAIDPLNLDTYTYVLISGGVMAGTVIDACCQLLKDEMVFYDVGANAGVVSLEVAKHFHDRVTVCAFEPQESLVRCVAASAQLNGFKRMHVFRTLLGNESGFADLYIPKSSAPASHASLKSRTPKSEVVRNRIETLDGLVHNKVIPAPNVIKIDVEGAELAVLQGAENLIEQYAPCIIFESDSNAERFGYTRRDICEFLQKHNNYRFQFPTTEGLVDVGERLFDFTQSDIVAVPYN